VSFGPSQEQAALAAALPATASVVPAPSDATPRTTQFFADRTRPVLVDDQGAIGRWGRSGNLAAALSQESQEEDPPATSGNALAMRFRAVHQKPTSDAVQVRGFVLLTMNDLH
jgi:hypothetical protein